MPRIYSSHCDIINLYPSYNRTVSRMESPVKSGSIISAESIPFPVIHSDCFARAGGRIGTGIILPAESSTFGVTAKPIEKHRDKRIGFLFNSLFILRYLFIDNYEASIKHRVLPFQKKVFSCIMRHL